MRPTVNDIAREAGVSLATVDRVLNDRPGVRAKTVEAVQEAIRRIGYVRDVAAANLARQRDYRLAFVLPDTDSQFIRTLLGALSGRGICLPRCAPMWCCAAFRPKTRMRWPAFWLSCRRRAWSAWP